MTLSGTPSPQIMGRRKEEADVWLHVWMHLFSFVKLKYDVKLLFKDDYEVEPKHLKQKLNITVQPPHK